MNQDFFNMQPITLVLLPPEILTHIFSYFLPSSTTTYYSGSIWEQMSTCILPLLHTCTTFRNVIRNENYELWKACFIDPKWDYTDSIFHRHVNNLMESSSNSSDLKFQQIYEEMMEFLGIVMGGSKVVKRLTIAQVPTNYLDKHGVEKSWLTRIMDDFCNIEQLVWMDSCYANTELSNGRLIRFEKLKTLSIYTDDLSPISSLILCNCNVSDLSLSLSTNVKQELRLLPAGKTFEVFELTNGMKYSTLKDDPSLFKFISFLSNNDDDHNKNNKDQTIPPPLALFTHLHTYSSKFESIHLDSNFKSDVLVCLDLNCTNLEITSGVSLPKLKRLELEGVKSCSWKLDNNQLPNLKELSLTKTSTQLLEYLPLSNIEVAHLIDLPELEIGADRWAKLKTLYLSNISSINVSLNQLDHLEIYKTLSDGKICIKSLGELDTSSIHGDDSSGSFELRIDKLVNGRCGTLKLLEHVGSVEEINIPIFTKIEIDDWKYLTRRFNQTLKQVSCRSGNEEMVIDCLKYDLSSIAYDECFKDHGELKFNKYATSTGYVSESDLNVETVSDLKVTTQSSFPITPNAVIPLFTRLTKLTVRKTSLVLDLSLLPKLVEFSYCDSKEKSSSSLVLNKFHPTLKFLLVKKVENLYIDLQIDCPRLRELILLNSKFKENSKLTILNAPKLLTLHVDNLQCESQ